MYAQTLSLAQLALILRARWKVLAGVWLGTIALAVAFSLLWPPKYTATASLVVDVQSPDPVGGLVLAGSLLSSYMATQLDMLRSERVILRAIQSAGLVDDPELKQKWMNATEGRGKYEAWLAEDVLDDFVVKPTRGSNAVTVAYASRDPARAAAMANALVRSYMDTALELRTEPAREYNSFFDKRSRDLRDALEMAQGKLSVFQRQNGLLANDERFDVETTRLNELSSQIVVLQGAANEADGRQSQAAANPSRMPEVLANALVAQLSTEISRTRAKLEELSLRFGSNHPRVLEAQASLTELNQQLSVATRQASGVTAMTSSVAKTRLKEASADFESQRSKVLRLKAQRDEAAVLLRDVESAQRAYDLTLARMTQSFTESQVRPTNISVIKSATEPAIPSFPKPLLITAASIIVGMFLAVGSAMTQEYFDQRLRTEQDVTQVLNQPLLAHINGLALSGQASRRRAFKKRVLSGLPRPAAR